MSLHRYPGLTVSLRFGGSKAGWSATFVITVASFAVMSDGCAGFCSHCEACTNHSSGNRQHSHAGDKLVLENPR
jgi:hypothetical protein